MTTDVDKAHRMNVTDGLSGRKSPKSREVSQKHRASNAVRGSPHAASGRYLLRFGKL